MKQAGPLSAEGRLLQILSFAGIILGTFFTPCTEENKEQERDSEAEPQQRLHKPHRGEHIPVAFQVDDDDDERKDIGAVPAQVLRETESAPGVRLPDEGIPAPAVFARAEEDEGKASQGQEIVGDDKVFQIENRLPGTQRLETGPHVVAQNAGNAENRHKDRADGGAFFSGPAEAVHVKCDDIFKDRDDRRECGKCQKYKE